MYQRWSGETHKCAVEADGQRKNGAHRTIDEGHSKPMYNGTEEDDAACDKHAAYLRDESEIWTTTKEVVQGPAEGKGDVPLSSRRSSFGLRTGRSASAL